MLAQRIPRQLARSSPTIAWTSVTFIFCFIFDARVEDRNTENAALIRSLTHENT